MNKHILLVMKWLNNKDSVSQEELEENRKSACDDYAAAYAVADAGAAARAAGAAARAAYAAAYAVADAGAGAEKWVNKYFSSTKENKQEYIHALKSEETKPDWSNAPEWADRIMSMNTFLYWFNKDRFAEFNFYSISGDSAPLSATANSIDDFELIEMRPEVKPDAWVDGLPPVGCECEVESDIRGEWKKATYVGMDSIGSHVFDVEKRHLWRIDSVSVLVRPLKTQDEIDREAFKAAVSDAIYKSQSTYCDRLEKISYVLFNAGFTAPKGDA